MHKIFFLIIGIFLSFRVTAQSLEYLNSFQIVIKDTNKYSPNFYRIKSQFENELIEETYSMDSIRVKLVQQKMSQKDSLIQSTKTWFYKTGELEKVEKYLSGTDQTATYQYYKLGSLRSKSVKKGDYLISENYYAENGEKMEKPIIVDVLPKDGLEAWNQYLRDNFRYPESARRAGYEGKVYVSLIVTEKGEMEDVQVINPEENHFLLNQEALRVVKKYPYQWKPMTIDNVPERCITRLPINFKLTD